MILKYSITYVNEEKGLEKHIMRYPQMFATKAIERKLNDGIKKGIIWHTQGSGKTALAYYNVKYLTDYFQQKGIVPKFYFIVDRIDLMNQAKREFTSRGLIVHTVNSKDELLRNFRTRQAIHNLSGKREITVVNIQKFKDDTDVLKANDYDISSQRIYFLDEVHRSYNPKGSFFLFSFNKRATSAIIKPPILLSIALQTNLLPFKIINSSGYVITQPTCTPNFSTSSFVEQPQSMNILCNVAFSSLPRFLV
jgi:type I restriction enzyme R subunit